MPFFLYQARDNKGKVVRGQIEATNEAIAADILLARQETPIKITLTDEEQTATQLFDGVFNRVKIQHLVVFSRQMYSLTKAGIPMIRAIVGLSESTTNKILKNKSNKIFLNISFIKPLRFISSFIIIVSLYFISKCIKYFLFI